MSGAGAQSIPFPVLARGRDEAAGSPAELAGAFVRATAGMRAEDAAALAAIRPETLRKWRRRVPRWLKADTARRITAWLAGEAPAAPRADEGFHRAFRLTLRPAPAE